VSMKDVSARTDGKRRLRELPKTTAACSSSSLHERTMARQRELERLRALHVEVAHTGAPGVPCGGTPPDQAAS
jgi:hypothetical protein